MDARALHASLKKARDGPSKSHRVSSCVVSGSGAAWLLYQRFEVIVVIKDLNSLVSPFATLSLPFLPFSLLPSPFSLLPSPFSLLPAPFSLLPSPFTLLPSPFTLPTPLLACLLASLLPSFLQHVHERWHTGTHTLCSRLSSNVSLVTVDFPTPSQGRNARPCSFRYQMGVLLPSGEGDAWVTMFQVPCRQSS